jgi:UDP-N-acetylglucosamine 2-epimerase (non-hydrolysing)
MTIIKNNKTKKIKKSFYTLIFGTRPEFLKMKPLIMEFHKRKEIPFQVIYIQQHKHITGLELPNIRYKTVDIEENSKVHRMEDVAAQIFQKLPIYLSRSTHIIVQGDTETAFMCAVTAFQMKIKVVHIEAGLRTYNLEKPFPEEGYRQMISRISSFNFTPHKDSEKILKEEKVSGKIYTVGNTIIDLVKSYNLKPILGSEVLITFHRRENWDNIETCIKQINTLVNIYSNLQFTWFLHPNKTIQKIVKRNISSKVNLEEPLEHREFATRIAESYAILTDSGGIQEEASFLGKQCIVLRTSTERDHIKYPYIQTIKSFEDIENIFSKLKNKLLTPCYVYGKGDSSEKIYNILSK